MKNRLEEIKRLILELEHKDRWDSKDHDYFNKLRLERNRLLTLDRLNKLEKGN